MPSTQTDRLTGLTTSVAVKAPCYLASTGNLTLSSTQTIDGVAPTTGDRILVWQQTNSTQNGIYNYDSSTWPRAKDFDGTRDVVRGTLVYVSTGTTFGGAWFSVTSTGINIPGSSTITFEETGAFAGSYRGSWSSDTYFHYGDIIRDSTVGDNTKNVYVCSAGHNSSAWATNSTSSTAAKWDLVVDVAAINSTAISAAQAVIGTDELSFFIPEPSTGTVTLSRYSARPRNLTFFHGITSSGTVTADIVNDSTNVGGFAALSITTTESSSTASSTATGYVDTGGTLNLSITAVSSAANFSGTIGFVWGST